MSLLTYQPELASTINLISGLRIGFLPAVIFFGFCFVILIIAGYFIAKHYKWSIKNIILLAALVTWLPLFIQFSYSSIIEFKSIANFIGAPEEIQTLWRYCNIDKNHQLGGGFCTMYPFTQTIKQSIPVGSSVKLFSSNIGVYLYYYLYGFFNITSSNSADYIIVYYSPAKFYYEGKKLYLLQNDSQDYLGEFEVVGTKTIDVAVYKRILK